MIAENTSLRTVSVSIAREVNIALQAVKVVLHATNANVSTTRQFVINAIINFWQPLVMRKDRYATLLLL
jgi:hypothetical protein